MQLKGFMWRRLSTTYWRNVDYNATRINYTVVVGLIFGSAFWQRGQAFTVGWAEAACRSVICCQCLCVGWQAVKIRIATSCHCVCELCISSCAALCPADLPPAVLCQPQPVHNRPWRPA